MAWHWKPAIKTNVIYQQRTKVKTLIFNHDRFQDVVINKNYSCRPVNLQRIPVSLYHAKAGNPRRGRHELHSLDSGFPAKICDLLSISEGASAASSPGHQVPCVLIFSDIWRKRDPGLFRRRTETLLLPLMVVKKVNLSKEAGRIHDFRRSLRQQHARRTQSSGTWNRHAFLRRDQQGIITMAQRNRLNVSTSNNASLIA